MKDGLEKKIRKILSAEIYSAVRVIDKKKLYWRMTRALNTGSIHHKYIADDITSKLLCWYTSIFQSWHDKHFTNG